MAGRVHEWPRSARGRMEFEVTGKILKDSSSRIHTLSLFLWKIKTSFPGSVMNGLERGPGLKQSQIIAICTCVLSPLLGCKFSEAGRGSVSCFPFTAWYKPLKIFYWVHEEDISCLYLLPCQSQLPLCYRRKSNWVRLHAPHKALLVFCVHFVSERPSFPACCWQFAWWCILGNASEWWLTGWLIR